MLRAAPLLAITAIVVFTAPNFVDGMSKLVVVFVTYLLYEMVYSMFNIPYGSLLSAMSKNEEERAQLSSARGIGGMLGKRTEGSIYGTFNMLRRLGQAIGSSGSVAILGLVGYDVVLSNMGQPQNAETILGIKVLCILVPAIVSLGSWAAFRFIWNITPELKAKMAEKSGI